MSFVYLLFICLFIGASNAKAGLVSRETMCNLQNNEVDVKLQINSVNRYKYSCDDFNDKDKTLTFCNEFLNDVNEQMLSRNTSIRDELVKKISDYEKQKNNFDLNDKNIDEYEELNSKLDMYKELLSNYDNVLYDVSPSMVVINPNITIDNTITDSALLTIYSAAVAYFSANGYLLAEELLEHMKLNNSINSCYKPSNTEVISNTNGYKRILSYSVTRGNYSFEKDGTKSGNDAYYSLHSVNYNKTSNNSGVVISDRYDYAYDMSYDDFKTDAVCNAMYTLQERVYLTPYYVIVECSKSYSCNVVIENIYMNNNTCYIEKTAVIGKGDSVQYNLSVANSAKKTIQTFGPDDTYIKVYDSNNNLLVSNDDSGYKLNAMVNYLFSAGQNYKVVVSMFSKTKIGNIRVGFASVDVQSFNSIDKIEKTKGFFSDKYKDIDVTTNKYYGNIFTLQNNEEKDFTIQTKKNGNSYIDTYLYMIDPRRSNYYDGIGKDDDYHPMYIYNDDGAGNNQAKIEVKYKQFFSKNTDYIIICSTYNLTKLGKYTIDINGLDKKHGTIVL